MFIYMSDIRYPVNGFWFYSFFCKCSEDFVTLHERTRSGCLFKVNAKIKAELGFSLSRGFGKRENSSYDVVKSPPTHTYPLQPQISLSYSPVFKKTYYIKKKSDCNMNKEGIGFII